MVLLDIQKTIEYDINDGIGGILNGLAIIAGILLLGALIHIIELAIKKIRKK